MKRWRVWLGIDGDCVDVQGFGSRDDPRRLGDWYQRKFCTASA